MKLIGGRKLALGFGFLATSTAIAVIVVFHQATVDWVGLAAFTAAQASGILSLMVGFNAEYKGGAASPTPPTPPAAPQQ